MNRCGGWRVASTITTLPRHDCLSCFIMRFGYAHSVGLRYYFNMYNTAQHLLCVFVSFIFSPVCVGVPRWCLLLHYGEHGQRCIRRARPARTKFFVYFFFFGGWSTLDGRRRRRDQKLRPMWYRGACTSRNGNIFGLDDGCLTSINLTTWRRFFSLLFVVPNGKTWFSTQQVGSFQSSSRKKFPALAHTHTHTPSDSEKNVHFAIMRLIQMNRKWSEMWRPMIRIDSQTDR